MNLSKNFTLEEMLRSDTATRLGFDEQTNPPKDVVDNLEALCINVLQKIRDKLGKTVRVVSAYRAPRTNAAVGGVYTIIGGKLVQTSQHCKGEAADIEIWVDGKECNSLILAAIKELVNTDKSFKFDQVIKEFSNSEPFDENNPKWVHVSFKRFGTNRMQVLKAYKTGKKTRYEETHL